MSSEGTPDETKRRRSELWFVVISVGLAIVTVTLAVAKVPVPYLSRRTPSPVETSIKPEEVLASAPMTLGKGDAPFKLVMFGDYECPPCRAEWPRIEAFAKSHPDKLAVQFRHLPLPTLHPNATRAATIAEIAREHGDFLAMHRRLFSTAITGPSLDAIEAKGRSKSDIGDSSSMAAKRRVMLDLNVAKSLGLSGTPSLFMIRDGEVFKISSVEQIKSVVE